MGHTPYSELLDLEDLLAEIRTWPYVFERSPGVFYVKRLPFLHFHSKGGARWADVRAGTTWGSRLEVPTRLTPTDRESFATELRARFEATVSSPRQRAPA